MMTLSAEQIEDLVQSRQTLEARKAITVYLRERAGSDQAEFRACDWYRRLGFFREAFLLLDIERLLGLHASSEADRTRLFWIARLLNLQGASSFALALVRRLECRTAFEHRVAANLFYSNYEYASALRHFLEMERLDPDPASYLSRLARISRVDCHRALGESRLALRLSRETQAASREPLLRGIAWQAQAEIHAEAESFDEAWIALEEAERYFPESEATVDRALLLKWKGYVLAHLGRPQHEANACFDAAWSNLRSHGNRAESWLEVLRLKACLGWLDEEQKLRLRRYPGLPDGFLKQLSASSPRVEAIGAGPRVSICFFPESDEYEFPRKTSRLGTPLELQLVAMLRVAGEWGLSQVRAMSLLWPDEPHAYLQLPGRLRQLIFRARGKYGIGIESVDGDLRLSSRVLERISMEWTGDPRPGLMRVRKDFSFEEASKFYDLKRTRLKEYLEDWQGRGWIAPARENRKVVYRVNPWRQADELRN